MATFEQARDDIGTIMKAAWEADPASSGLPLLYEDKEEAAGQIPDDVSAWGRLEIKFSTSIQAGHGDSQKRWNRTGFVFMNLYTTPGEGNETKDDLLKVVMDTFEGTSTTNGVLLHEIIVDNKGIVSEMRETRVSIAFDFDELK